MSTNIPEKKTHAILKKRDLILLAALLSTAGIIALILYAAGLTRGAADTIEITIDGASYGTYSLMENQEIPIETDAGYNLVIIENGAAHMEEADCPDGYCMDQGTISQNGQTIVCLPHKVVVTAFSSDGSESVLDGVAQ